MTSQHDPFDDDDDEGSGAIDADTIRSYIAFCTRAIRKRWLLVVLMFAGGSALVLTGLAVWPRTYYCETRISAQNTGALGSEAKDPFGDASTTLQAHDTLKAIVEQTDLAKHWHEGRAPILRLKDAIMGWLGTETPSEADLTEMLIPVLPQKLNLQVTWDGVLAISATWSTPEMAARLAETARQTFLEKRHVSETSTIAENISILEGHVGKVREEIYEIAESVKKAREDKSSKAVEKATAAAKSNEKAAPAAAPRPLRVVRTLPPPPDEELTSMSVMLEAKENAIKELEAERGRKVRDLQAKLRELQLTYTDVHPEVVHAKMNLQSLESESPQVTALKADVAKLEAAIKKRRMESAAAAATPITGTGGGGRVTGSTEPRGSTAKLPAELLELMRDNTDVDPTIQAQFDLAMHRYSELQSNIASARVQLDQAQAAFRYRYKVLTPVEVPRAPIAPKTKLIAPAGMAGALVFALLMALLAELRTGTIVERWQVQRLRLPVLAEVKLPPGPSR